MTDVDEAECPICGTVADTFDDGGHPSRPRPDCLCPTCGSLERHRALWLYFRKRTTLFTERTRMLHVAPDTSLAPRFAALPNVDYLSADLNPAKAMVVMDLTAINLPDESFDLILASHVLEHIPDDNAAMRELRRMLRPGGRAVLAVPVSRRVTAEDLTITDAAERARLYGQHDHVRAYGRDGVFEERLRDAGFDVTSDMLIDQMDPALRQRYRILASEPIFSCTFGVPIVPRSPVVDGDAEPGDGQVTVSWHAPVSDGGAPVTGYVVTPYIGLAPLESSVFAPTSTRHTITGLTNGVEHRFRVQAVNAIGTSSYSKATRAVTPVG